MPLFAHRQERHQTGRQDQHHTQHPEMDRRLPRRQEQRTQPQHEHPHRRRQEGHGAKVEAFDTRPVVEEQVKSLGATFVKIDLGEMGQTDQGYAKELTPEQILRQQEAQAKVCERANIVITTAKVFGRKAPVLIKEDVLDRMQPGSIVVDMAVSTGGNVEGSRLFENVVRDNGVTIMSGDLLERQVPFDASKMFSGNITAFLTHFYDKETKSFSKNTEDEILRGCLLTDGGSIIHERFKGGAN